MKQRYLPCFYQFSLYKAVQSFLVTFLQTSESRLMFSLCFLVLPKDPATELHIVLTCLLTCILTCCVTSSFLVRQTRGLQAELTRRRMQSEIYRSSIGIESLVSWGQLTNIPKLTINPMLHTQWITDIIATVTVVFLSSVRAEGEQYNLTRLVALDKTTVINMTVRIRSKIFRTTFFKEMVSQLDE